jgi:cytochrome c553
MTKLRNTAGLLVALGCGSGLALQAQDYSEGPGMAELERRLGVDSVLFNATIDEPPDDDMLELGRLVAMGGAENGGSGMACITCHGVEGHGDGSGAFPRLDGQAGWYLYKQLNDYASGDRPNRVMSGIAARLTDAEREAVSAYYAAMPVGTLDSARGEIDGTLLQWGGQLAAVGSAEKGIPACVNCHGAQGTGLPPSVPYLAGQYAGYLELQLQLWKEGTRDNDAMNVMEAIARKMSDEDMRAVSEYYARVANPAELEPIPSRDAARPAAE